MNKILVKNSEGRIAELVTTNGAIPTGWEAVPQEELQDAAVSKARESKMEQIRAERNIRLVENDKQWMIKKKKGQSTTSLENEAQALRDLPETAQAALDEMNSVEDIQNYDAFEEL